MPGRNHWKLNAALFIACCLPLTAQQQASSGADMQREAMRRLSFLAGRWSRACAVSRGPGEPLHLTQSEDVQYKLDGLVLLVEGKSTDAAGKIVFAALATISYDDTSHTYRFRAYNDGHYVDTELSAPADGFSWSLSAGPAHIVNTLHLSAKGEWSEVTDVTVGSNPPHRTLELLLRHE